MACPSCGCKLTYQYCHDNGMDVGIDDYERDRCSACNAVFYVDDHLPEADDEDEYWTDAKPSQPITTSAPPDPQP